MATFNSNIYDMSAALHDMSKNLIPDEDDETLALGTYGFLNSVFSRLLSDGIRIAQENSNEMFYNRARLPKNIMAYSIAADIEDINAVPATVPVSFWIVKDSLDALIEEHGGDYAVIDDDCSFTIGKFQYCLDYDLQISKREIDSRIIYTAKYDMAYKNTLSDIEYPFIPAPYTMKRNGVEYVCFYVTLRQVSKKAESFKIISTSTLENKSYQFEFEEQLANFDVYVQQGSNTVRLKPIFSGAPVYNEKYYCDYTFIDDTHIRVLFNSDSFVPDINAVVTTVIQTTKGAAANITYLDPITKILEDTDSFAYLSTQVCLFAQGKSENGKDKRTIKELQRLLPQMTLTRENLISNSDLNNFFNQISSEVDYINFFPHEDNQKYRTYYGYYLHKDKNNNIVPTNTVDLSFDINTLDSNDKYVKRSYVYENGKITATRYTFEPGVYIGYEKQVLYDRKTGLPVVDETTGIISLVVRSEFITNPNTLLIERDDLVINCLMKNYGYTYEQALEMDDLKYSLQQLTLVQYYYQYGFLYTFPYRVTICGDGPYVSYYIPTMNEIYKINYERGNIESPLEMILTYAKWTRPYTGKNNDRYTLLIQITQNISEDFNLLMEVDKSLIAMASYSLLEQFTLSEVTDAGILTGNTVTTTVANKFADITELILKANMSAADSVLATDNNGGGNYLYSSVDKGMKYYVVNNTENSTTTNSYSTYQEAYDQYDACEKDSENVYIKMIDSTGKQYRFQNTNKDPDIALREQFSPNKRYIESHLNTVNGQMETTEYNSLIDALHQSALLYYTSQPVKNYTISEALIDTEQYNNQIYDSAKDNTNDDLYFLQIKNNEGIINVRTTYNTIRTKIDMIPKNEEYEYMVFDRYGIIQEGLNTYEKHYEEFTSEQEEIPTIDEYSDFDIDIYRIYNDEDLLDKLIIQQFKVVVIDPTTGKAATAVYLDTLLGCVRYMASLKCSCLLYYKNKDDISSTVFTQNKDDYLYEYAYVAGEPPIARFAISNDTVTSASGEKRYLTICRNYDSEELSPNDPFDLSEMQDKDGFRCNFYQFDYTEPVLRIFDHGDNPYTDSGEISYTVRNYRICYSKDGFNKTTKSFMHLKDALDEYQNGDFKNNKLVKFESKEDGGEGYTLFNGFSFKERYYIEFMNDADESNCYVITSRSKLSYIYAKVYNAIKKNIELERLTKSTDPAYYIRLYDQFGNQINIDDFYIGTEYGSTTLHKYYPVWAHIRINIEGKVKNFTNIFDAFNYAGKSTKAFTIEDSEGRTIYTSAAIGSGYERYIQLRKSESGSQYNIYTSRVELDKAALIYDANSYYPITQSYKITWDSAHKVFNVETIYMKDISEGYENTWIDISSVTGEANLGIEIPKTEEEEESDTETVSASLLSLGVDNTTSAAISSGNLAKVVLSDGSVARSIDELVDILTKNPDLTIMSVIRGDSEETPDEDSGVQVINLTRDKATVINDMNVICRLAAILVIYDEKNKPVCYYEGKVVDYNLEEFSYVFRFQLLTDDVLDKNNQILLKKGTFGTDTACYYPQKATVADRYVNYKSSAKIYLMSKFADEDGSNLKTYGYLGLYPSIADLDHLGLMDYTATNIYNITDGLEFFENFSEIVNTIASVSTSSDKSQVFKLKSVPVISHRYTMDNDRILDFIKELKAKKAYVEKSLDILENQYSIDFKLYNTYGPANIFYTTDINEENSEIIDRVNITANFAVKLMKSSDDYTIGYIQQDIKDAVNDISKLDEYHMQNLVSEIYQKYKNSIYYIEFRGFNGYESDRKHFFVDEDLKKVNVPEFININILISEDGTELTTDINIPSI